ncbi:MAG: transglutaminase family protein [Desulfurococcaceae archaeon]
MIKTLVIIMLLLTALVVQSVSTNYSQVFIENNIEKQCRVFYFINAILIERSKINTTLALETPGNITFYDINQTSKPLIYRNVFFNHTTNLFEFNVTINSSFYGYHVLEIKVCYPNIEAMYSIVADALVSPKTGSTSGDIPEEIKNEYLKEPYRRVVEIVGSNYTDWFMRTYKYNVTEASKLGIAVTAAYFVYGVFFEYDASGLPRTMDQVINERKGDCDDLSRILVELLNYYEIPATIAYGYVYLPLSDFENYSITIRNFTYIFRYNGPHAFTLAYIPGYGWISLDLLAGSLLTYDFVFEGFSSVTYVNETIVREVEELHAKIHGLQFMALLSEGFFKTIFDPANLTSSIEAYINRTLIALTGSTNATNNTSTEIISETSSSETSTETTVTPIESTSNEYLNQTHPRSITNVLQLFPLAILSAVLIIAIVTVLLILSITKEKPSTSIQSSF